MPTSLARAIATEILAERDRQDAKFGRAVLPTLPDGTGADRLLGLAGWASSYPEWRDSIRDSVDKAADAGESQWALILLEEVFEALAESDVDALRTELIQVAAVAAKWVEGLDIRAGRRPGRNRVPHRFLPAHLRVVVLLCESQGSTHTRLERAWAAKAARTGADAWPMIAASGLRTRVSELVRWGIVEPAGTHGRTVSNRPARVWQLATDKTRRAAIAAGTARPVHAIAPETRDALAALLDEAGADIVTRAALESVASAAGVNA